MHKILAAIILVLTSSAAFADNSGASKVPVIMVRGWGGFLLTSFRFYKRFLQDDGYAARDLYEIKYDFRGDVDEVDSDVHSQLQAIFARYPKGQTFDIIGHSTGQFVALQAITAHHLAPRFRKVISLAGIAGGWDFLPAEAGWMGQLVDRLSPYQSDFVQDFFALNGDAIEALDTCTLFSPDDRLVAPYDSGRLPGGVNVEVPGMRHLAAIKEWRWYHAMREACYDE